MARKASKTVELSVFKGREARLNRAIFQILSLKGPQTIYDIHKSARCLRGYRHLHYGNVNRRVRVLESRGYLKAAGTVKTKAGFEAIAYKMTFKTCLALIFEAIGTEEILNKMDEGIAAQIFAMLRSSLVRTSG